MAKTIGPTYLGDGVYASFDGFNINLHVGAHNNPAFVAIEPEVLRSLLQYAKTINTTFGVEHFVGISNDDL
jgi:hypothetical protein